MTSCHEVTLPGILAAQLPDPGNGPIIHRRLNRDRREYTLVPSCALRTAPSFTSVPDAGVQVPGRSVYSSVELEHLTQVTSHKHLAQVLKFQGISLLAAPLPPISQAASPSPSATPHSLCQVLDGPEGAPDRLLLGPDGIHTSPSPSPLHPLTSWPAAQEVQWCAKWAASGTWGCRP